MFENALTLHGASVKTKITCKALVSVGLIALAMLLPQLVHATYGAAGGAQLLPMYLPILIGGCLLGAKWGIAVGLLSPLCSFLMTSMTGVPMPDAVRLPYMMAELAVFALISGLFTDRISAKPVFAFPAVLLSCLCGRAAFLALAFVFEDVSEMQGAMAWSQICGSWMGLLMQIIAVPLIIMALNAVLMKEKQ